MANFQDVDLIIHGLLDIVVAYAAGNDADGGILPCLYPIIYGGLGSSQHVLLFPHQDIVAGPRYAGKQHPAVGAYAQLCHLVRLAYLHGGTAVCRTGNDAQDHGFLQLFGEFEGTLHHVVGLLLIGGLEGRHHGKGGIEAAVLLVLAGVHGSGRRQPPPPGLHARR